MRSFWIFSVYFEIKNVRERKYITYIPTYLTIKTISVTNMDNTCEHVFLIFTRKTSTISIEFLTWQILFFNYYLLITIIYNNELSNLNRIDCAVSPFLPRLLFITCYFYIKQFLLKVFWCTSYNLYSEKWFGSSLMSCMMSVF